MAVGEKANEALAFYSSLGRGIWCERSANVLQGEEGLCTHELSVYMLGSVAGSRKQ